MTNTQCGSVTNGGRAKVLASSDWYYACDRVPHHPKDGPRIRLGIYFKEDEKVYGSLGRLRSPQERFDNFVKKHGGLTKGKDGNRYIMIKGKKLRVSNDLLKDVKCEQDKWEENIQMRKKIFHPGKVSRRSPCRPFSRL